VHREDLQLAKDLHNRYFGVLLAQESLDTTPLDDGILFELTYHSDAQHHSVWIIISYDALKDLNYTKSYCVIALLRLLLYDIRTTKPNGRYKVGVEAS